MEKNYRINAKKTDTANFIYIAGAVVLLVVLVLLLSVFGGIGPSEAAEDTGAEIVPEIIQTVRINELMSDNSLFAQAGDGRFYDWVELYNTTGEPIDMTGWCLSDNPERLNKSDLTGLVIQPYSYALVYMSRASGLDENGVMHANFALSSLGETLYLTDYTVEPEGKTVSEISIPASNSNVSYGYDSTGTLVWFSTPTPRAENGGLYSEQADKLVYEMPMVTFNEYMSANKAIIYDCEGDYNDWIELYNDTNESVDLSGCFLTDNGANPDKWEFPNGTVLQPGEYLLVFCSGKDKIDAQGYLHTNFSLGGDDVCVQMYTAQNILCGDMELTFLPDNVSYGYSQAEGENRYFSVPTPGKANTTMGFLYTQEQLEKMESYEN